MSQVTADARARRPHRTAVGLVFGLVVVVAALIGAFVDQRGPTPAPSLSDILPGDQGRPVTEVDGAVTGADGVLPDGVTVFDDQYPGVANLDPELLQALRTAASDAGHRGIEFNVNSGWRSPDYQDQLLRDAVAEYGSQAEAARWVATADTSPHVSGDAVDLGPYDTMDWLSRHGAQYGLCQIYGNEPWHFELRPEATDHGCPAMYADPTEDPRM
ncbi:M15 family metallopeptidase [Occultella gossypii]|uniref:M15 family metallopeptidase n=1 Tax=Occultella gossypii TaxID=2800820 RepID=A0ABS7SGM2_9MICO|nr:M15 family metallopeptidase [Occultella gossypii]MBZ2199063.1 M15 family metallopeptidase [Occultella gossypii]